MNFATLSLSFLAYAALIYWVYKKYNFTKHWKGPYQTDNVINSPLTQFVKRILDLFLVFFFLIALLIPVVVLIMAISQNQIATWGIDINVFSGFKLNLNEIPNIVALGVRNPEFSGKTNISIDTSNLYAWYLFVLISQFSAIVGIFVSSQLRNMVLSLQANLPFIGENSVRIKRIGIVMIVWNLFNPFLQYFGWGAAVNQISINNGGIELYPAFEINVLALMIGLMLLLLSKMLNEAALIQKEQELTI